MTRKGCGRKRSWSNVSYYPDVWWSYAVSLDITSFDGHETSPEERRNDLLDSYLRIGLYESFSAILLRFF
jgi:uncharacterized protein YraI